MFTGFRNEILLIKRKASLQLNISWQHQHTLSLVLKAMLLMLLLTNCKPVTGVVNVQEELAEGLHLIDFEQLKIENQSLNEKIEERNEELAKLRKKTANTVQVCCGQDVQSCTAVQPCEIVDLFSCCLKVSECTPAYTSQLASLLSTADCECFTSYAMLCMLYMLWCSMHTG